METMHLSAVAAKHVVDATRPFVARNVESDAELFPGFWADEVNPCHGSQKLYAEPHQRVGSIEKTIPVYCGLAG
jgi:hypothetical protein